MHEKERIELLRELKRVLTLVLEHQHDDVNLQQKLTEDDPSVYELLIWVERCLWHGLRRSFLKGEQFEADSHVTLWTVITAGHFQPTSGGDAEVDAKDLTAFEDAKREVMDMIEMKTDAGRSRAWVRLALNKGVLGTFGWLRETDARTFYDPLSVWRSDEQKSIAVSLLGSLRGLKFSLRIDPAKLDADPEPSRRPHFLGISSLRSASVPHVVPKGPAIVETPETRARQERVRKEKEAMEALKGKMSHPAQQQQPAQTSSAGVTSWLAGAISWVTGSDASPAASSSDDMPKRRVKRLPPFLGSTLGELVMDPRTCEHALLEWRIGVPKAVSALLVMIDLEEMNDPFDPKLIAEEDNPKFVSEVGALIRRLSNRYSEPAAAAPSSVPEWDGGPPSMVAAAAVKLFFRQLPEPIIPYDVYDALVACQKIGDLSARTRNIKFLIDSIPDLHKPTLLALFDVVGRKCDSNVTSTISAAHALAPALLRPKPGPEGGLGRASEAAELISIMIDRREEIFADIAQEVRENKAKLERKLHRIRELYFDSIKSVEWPGDKDEEWMKRAWVALAPAEQGLEGFAPVTDEWVKRGFRTSYMTHDFRGCGLSALQNLVYLAETYHDFTMRMLKKHQTFVPPPSSEQEKQQKILEDSNMSYEEKLRREEEKSKFPFVLGAAQLSRSVVEMAGIDPKAQVFDPAQIAELSTWSLFNEEDAIGHLFALAMRLLDFEWTRQQAKAMDFNRIKREVVIKLAELIDKHRPSTIGELRQLLIRDIPMFDDFQPVPSPSKKAPPAATPVKTPSESKKPEGKEGEGDAAMVRRENSKRRSSSVISESGVQQQQNANSDLLPRLVVPFSNVEETLLQPYHVTALESALPSEYRGYDWELTFSTKAHGFNIDAFFNMASSHIATILVVSDVDTKTVFGGFCAEQWSNRGDAYYGTGQCFIFSFAGGVFRDFRWTRLNNFLMLSNDDCIAMGQGQGGFGIYIDGDLRQGTTSPCSTYGNETPLVMATLQTDGEEGKTPDEFNRKSSLDGDGLEGTYDGLNREFTCRGIELWSFIPKTVSKRRTSSVASNQ